MVTENMRQRVTLRDIAERCKVHPMTVSRALRNDKNISKENRARIQQVAAEMGYDPSANHAARRLVGRRFPERPVLNRTIALFFPREFYTMNYFLATFRGIMETAFTAQFELITTYSDFYGPTSSPNSIVRGDVDGVIFVESNDHSNLLSRLRSEVNFGNRPVVSLYDPIPTSSSVCSDDFGSTYAATTHLLELGHRRIIHLWTPKGNGRYAHRYEGCVQACRDHGVDPKRALVLVEKLQNVSPGEGAVVQPVLRALDAHPDITAIMAINDLTAIAIRETLAERGIMVPRDMSLIGFDDSDPMLDAERNNILTTVRLPLRAMGQSAATVLIDRITGRIKEEQHLELPTELIVRASTAPSR